jgi:hypothetical protein
MKKIITTTGIIFLLGAVLTLGGCGWGPWHGHGRGMYSQGSPNGASGRYWHGPQYGYNHYNDCGHSRY